MSVRPFHERNPVVIGAISLIVLGLLVLGAFKADSLPLIGGGTVYSAEFSEAAGLKVDDTVRIAGVKVGTVESIELHRDRVIVDFRVEDAYVGDRSEAAIKIETVLGDKYLALNSLGEAELDPDVRIPLERTAAPYDVVAAFSGLSNTLEQIDTEQLADSFEVLSETFRDTPDNVASSLDGLSRLSESIASRDIALQQLLDRTDTVTQVLANRDTEFTQLIQDSNTLLTEVERRRDLIHDILISTQQLSTQLSGLVADNQASLAPALAALSDVTAILLRNRDNIDATIEQLGPFVRVFANTLGNGRWFDSYVEGLIPDLSDLISDPTAMGERFPLPAPTTTEPVG
ncbi:MAG: MCE family protein [Actinomycetota bacterium]|nr:MCE family protein [Actinomycetota bacterium]